MVYLVEHAVSKLSNFGKDVAVGLEYKNKECLEDAEEGED